jgi:putative solute:sodium symporter small subunit
MADQAHADTARARWHRTQRTIVGLLAIWFAVTFGIGYFARQLDGLMLGWPFSFWVAAQGAQLVYLALVGVYARWARRLDADAGDGGD